MLFRRAFVPSLALILGVGLTACDGDGGADAGPADASAGPDAGAPFVCERTMVLEGVLDEQVEVTFDTTMAGTMPQDLGLNCGNSDAETRWAPQQVVEYRVPGTEPVSLEFTTINAETTPTMIVFVQARVGDCGTIMDSRFPPTCWGPVAPTPPAMPENAEWRTTGQLQANGGDTVFFFVTGFSEPPVDERNLLDRGTVRFQVTARANTPPTLNSALAVLDGEDVRFEASGRDPNANCRGVLLNFYDADGDMMDIYGDGQASLEFSAFQVRFDDPVSTNFDWTGGAWVRSMAGDGATQLGEYLVAQGAAEVLMRPYDAPFGIGEGMRVPLQPATIVGFNEPCSATALCRPELTCDATTSTCQPPTALNDRCNTAESVPLPGFSDTAVSVTVTGDLRSELADFSAAPGCTDPGATGSREALYQVDSPVDFDLLLTTERPGTGATDTVLYVRTVCADQGTELGCNNDGTGGVGSSLEVRDLAGGGYFIYVEELAQMEPPGTGAFELEVTARPILGTGATCDMAEVMNRCMNGACAAGVCP